MHIVITKPYYDLKIEELYLAFEYQKKKQEEKEALKEVHAKMREAAKLQKELKEQTHYQTAYERIQEQLRMNPSNYDLPQKKTEPEERLTDVNAALTDIDHRQRLFTQNLKPSLHIPFLRLP